MVSGMPRSRTSFTPSLRVTYFCSDMVTLSFRIAFVERRRRGKRRCKKRQNSQLVSAVFGPPEQIEHTFDFDIVPCRPIELDGQFCCLILHFFPEAVVFHAILPI